MDQKLRKNIFYGILLLGVLFLIYQPTVPKHPYIRQGLGGQFCFIWESTMPAKSTYDGSLGTTPVSTDWGKLLTIEVILISSGFLFYRYTEAD